jgi:hypothetical protein
MALWQDEFGDEYDVPHDIDARMIDTSWHNDACPSFTLDLADGDTLKLWVDHPELSARDYAGKRYTLVRIISETTYADGGRTVEESENVEELLSTDDLSEVLSTLSEYPEL